MSDRVSDKQLDRVERDAKERLKNMGMWEPITLRKLSKEMAHQHSNTAFVGVMRARAEANKNRASAKLKVTKARVDKMLRKKYRDGKKPSEKEIENRVVCHSLVCEAADEYLKAKFEFNILWAMVTSMSQKAEMLTNLAHDRRKELSSGQNSRVMREERVKNKLSNVSTKRKKRSR